MKSWQDDINLLSKSEGKFLKLLERFFQICQKYGIYLSAKKCVFFWKSLRWCGRNVQACGYPLDPIRIQGLREMHLPKTAEEILQFVHCCRWMPLAIPDFARRIAPFDLVLDEAYQRS